MEAEMSSNTHTIPSYGPKATKSNNKEPCHSNPTVERRTTKRDGGYSTANDEDAVFAPLDEGTPAKLFLPLQGTMHEIQLERVRRLQKKTHRHNELSYERKHEVMVDAGTTERWHHDIHVTATSESEFPKIGVRDDSQGSSHRKVISSRPCKLGGTTMTSITANDDLVQMGGLGYHGQNHVSFANLNAASDGGYYRTVQHTPTESSYNRHSSWRCTETYSMYETKAVPSSCIEDCECSESHKSCSSLISTVRTRVHTKFERVKDIIHKK
ncbi:hypothetical protein BJX61DRAFT_509934 [Aspergillus egyptiacus]|nr:hypothetical protein BJX61DRAFT_509934 [Aspergillus egyptiacus]